MNFNELKNTDFRGVDPFMEGNSDVLNIRWSNSIHQSILLIFVWLGVPLGLLWFAALLYIFVSLRANIDVGFMGAFLTIYNLAFNTSNLPIYFYKTKNTKLFIQVFIKLL